MKIDGARVEDQEGFDDNNGFLCWGRAVLPYAALVGAEHVDYYAGSNPGSQRRFVGTGREFIKFCIAQKMGYTTRRRGLPMRPEHVEKMRQRVLAAKRAMRQRWLEIKRDAWLAKCEQEANLTRWDTAKGMAVKVRVTKNLRYNIAHNTEVVAKANRILSSCR